MRIDPDYRTWFTPQVITRAQEYQREGRVRYTDRTDGVHLFVVQGSNRTFYQVYLKPGPERGSVDAECSCPYEWDGYCEHIGAAIIEGLRRGLFELTGCAPRSEMSTDELTIDLDTLESTEPAGLPDVVRAFREETGTAGRWAVEHLGARYRLVFVVTKRRDWIYRERYTDDHVVRPALQYIRKDGAPGQIEGYSSTHGRRPTSSLERTLIDRIVRTHNQELHLAEVVFILLRSGATVLYRYGREHRPLRISAFTRAHVGFHLVGFDQGMSARFAPVVEFVDEGRETGRSPAVLAEELSVGDAGVGCYFLEASAGLIYFSETETSGTRQLRKLAGVAQWLSLSDIRALSTYADPETISVTPPTGRITVRNGDPIVRVVLKLTDTDTTVWTDMKYGERVVDLGTEQPFVVGPRDGENLMVWRRDRPREVELAAAVRRIVRLDGDAEQGIVVPMGVYAFLSEHGPELLDAGVQIVMFDGKPITSGKIEISASSGIDWLDLRVHVGGVKIRVSDIDFDTGMVLVAGRYHVVNRETLDRLRGLAANASVRDGGFRLSRLDLGTVELIEPLIEDSSGDPGLKRIRSAVARLKKGFHERSVTKPALLQAELRAYQHEGLGWLAFLAEFGFGGILADDMGLGKTVQAIALITHLVVRGIRGPFLVVAPVSTISNWEREIRRFAPGLTVIRHLGPDRSNDSDAFAAPGAVGVTSYHTLQRDVDVLGDTTWQLVVLDESQALKNPKSKNHESVRKLTFERVLAMSGTPVENNIGELWSIMSILNPGLLGGKASFLRRYGSQINRGDQAAVDRLRRTIRPFMLRRRKEEVAKDLPPKEEAIIDVVLSPAESSFYRSLKKSLRDEVQSLLAGEDPFRASTAIIHALTKLRQAAIAPHLVGGPNHSSKIDMVMDKLEEGVAEGHRVLVFSQYVRVLKMIEKRVEGRGWRYRSIDGSVPEKTRKRIIDEFQTGAALDLLLISLKAGGVGINLTQADYVFLVDPWWNPAVENQAVDRTHRIGQTHPVFAYRFISRGTVEEQILDLQETKRELVQNIVGDGKSIFASMSKEEILALFDDEAAPWSDENGCSGKVR